MYTWAHLCNCSCAACDHCMIIIMIVAVFPPLAHLFWCSDLLTRRFLSMRDSPTADVPTVVCCTYWWVVTITILALIITVILSSIVLTYLSGSSPPWSLEDPQQAIIIKISSPNHNLIHSRLRLSQHRTLSSAEDTTLRTIRHPPNPPDNTIYPVRNQTTSWRSYMSQRRLHFFFAIRNNTGLVCSSQRFALILRNSCDWAPTW
jgi:hypothetical protein